MINDLIVGFLSFLAAVGIATLAIAINAAPIAIAIGMVYWLFFT